VEQRRYVIENLKNSHILQGGSWVESLLHITFAPGS